MYFECILMYFAGNTPKYTSPRDTPKYTQNTLEYNLYSGRAKHEYTTNGEYISEAQIYIRNFRYNENTIVFCILTGARIHCIRHEDNSKGSGLRNREIEIETLLSAWISPREIEID